MSSTLFLFPCPIIEDQLETIPQYVIEKIHLVDIFITERARTTRRFLKSIDHPIPQSEIIVMEMDKHHPEIINAEFIEMARAGKTIGLFSEAGCPGVADPGALYVRKAYELGLQIKPLVGPSSILLALMASGMNGQNFAFVGYLPQQTNELTKKLKQLESLIFKSNQSQIFIETPYRNKKMVQNMLDHCSPNMQLCIAMDITGKDEYIQSKSIQLWRKTTLPELHKRPAIFILGK